MMTGTAERGGSGRFLASTLGPFQVDNNHASEKKARLENVLKKNLLICGFAHL